MPRLLIEVENVNIPGLITRVHAGKYDAMMNALIQILPGKEPGMTYREMVEAVLPHLPEDLFPGGETAKWWVKAVQLDLEAKRIIQRVSGSRPLRWYQIF